MKKKTNKKIKSKQNQPDADFPRDSPGVATSSFCFFLLELGPLFQFVFFFLTSSIGFRVLERTARGANGQWPFRSRRDATVREVSLESERTEFKKKNNHNQQNGANEEPSGRTQRCRRRLGAPCTSTRRRWPRRRAVRPATPPSIDGPRWPDVSLTNPVPSFLKFFFYFC